MRIPGIIASGLWLAFAATSAAAQVALSATDRLAAPFPYEARAVDPETVLQEIGARSSIPVIPAPSMRGIVTVQNADGTLRDALDRIAAQTGTLWWHDGAALRFESASTQISRLIPLGPVPEALLIRQIDALGLSDPRYPLRMSEAGLLRVVGPQGYGEAVADVVTQLAQRIDARSRAVVIQTTPEGETPALVAGTPVIIRGPKTN